MTHFFSPPFFCSCLISLSLAPRVGLLSGFIKFDTEIAAVSAAGTSWSIARETVTEGPPLTESFIHAQFNTHYVLHLKSALEIEISAG